MHPLRNLALLLGTVLPGTACSTHHNVADLALNDLFYVDVPFVTKAPGDRAVFVAPIVDARDGSDLPTQERGFPIVYAGDDFWERPVPEMVGEVLTRQLQSSQLFPSVDTHATAASLVLKPTLTAFTLGATEAVAGSRSFADVALRVQVLGPSGKDGKRVVLHDTVYAHRVASDLDFKPLSPYRLVAPALQATMKKLLIGLDGSNVARSEVPIDVDAPSEASGTRR